MSCVPFVRSALGICLLVPATRLCLLVRWNFGVGVRQSVGAALLFDWPDNGIVEDSLVDSESKFFGAASPGAAPLPWLVGALHTLPGLGFTVLLSSSWRPSAVSHLMLLFVLFHSYLNS